MVTWPTSYKIPYASPWHKGSAGNREVGRVQKIEDSLPEIMINQQQHNRIRVNLETAKQEQICIKIGIIRHFLIMIGFDPLRVDDNNCHDHKDPTHQIIKTYSGVH